MSNKRDSSHLRLVDADEQKILAAIEREPTTEEDILKLIDLHKKEKYKNPLDMPLIRAIKKHSEDKAFLDSEEKEWITFSKMFMSMAVSCGAYKFEDFPRDYFLTVEDVLKTTNVETRRQLLELYPGKLEGFLRDGGGEIVMEPKGELDYQHAKVASIRLPSPNGGRRGESRLYAILDNRTREPHAAKKIGRTMKELGYNDNGTKIYVVPLVKELKEYETMWDVVGSIWLYPPGQYYPDFEA